MNLEQFHNGKIELKEISEKHYSVIIKSENDIILAKTEIQDSLYDTWVGFSVGNNEFDLNVFDGEYFGVANNAKYGAYVYPVNNGCTDTDSFERLRVEEV